MGRVEIVHQTETGWIHHPDGDDLAVLPINFVYDEVKAKGIPLEWFATKEKIERCKIGPGDEDFIVPYTFDDYVALRDPLLDHALTLATQSCNIHCNRALVLVECESTRK